MNKNYTLLTAISLAALLQFTAPIFSMDDTILSGKDLIGNLLDDEYESYDADCKVQHEHDVMMQQVFTKFEKNIREFVHQPTIVRPRNAPKFSHEARESFNYAESLLENSKGCPSTTIVKEANLNFIWSALNYLVLAKDSYRTSGYSMINQAGISDMLDYTLNTYRALNQIKKPDAQCTRFMKQIKAQLVQLPNSPTCA